MLLFLFDVITVWIHEITVWIHEITVSKTAYFFYILSKKKIFNIVKALLLLLLFQINFDQFQINFEW